MKKLTTLSMLILASSAYAANPTVCFSTDSNHSSANPYRIFDASKKDMQYDNSANIAYESNSTTALPTNTYWLGAWGDVPSSIQETDANKMDLTGQQGPQILVTINDTKVTSIKSGANVCSNIPPSPTPGPGPSPKPSPSPSPSPKPGPAPKPSTDNYPNCITSQIVDITGQDGSETPELKITNNCSQSIDLSKATIYLNGQTNTAYEDNDTGILNNYLQWQPINNNRALQAKPAKTTSGFHPDYHLAAGKTYKLEMQYNTQISKAIVDTTGQDLPHNTASLKLDVTKASGMPTPSVDVTCYNKSGFSWNHTYQLGIGADSTKSINVAQNGVTSCQAVFNPAITADKAVYIANPGMDTWKVIGSVNRNHSIKASFTQLPQTPMVQPFTGTEKDGKKVRLISMPFLDTSLFTQDQAKTIEQSNLTGIILAFGIQDTNGNAVLFGTNDNASQIVDMVDQLHKEGKMAVISFGGQNGTPVADKEQSAQQLANQYLALIHKFHATDGIDFDIEGGALSNLPANLRRVEATKIVLATMRKTNPHFYLSLTLPAQIYGVPVGQGTEKSPGEVGAILQQFNDLGVYPTYINGMTMCMNASLPQYCGLNKSGGDISSDCYEHYFTGQGWKPQSGGDIVGMRHILETIFGQQIGSQMGIGFTPWSGIDGQGFMTSPQTMDQVEQYLNDNNMPTFVGWWEMKDDAEGGDNGADYGDYGYLNATGNHAITKISN